MAWTRLCSREELPPVGQTRLCEIAGEGGAVVRIALARTEAGLFALDDHCPHRAGPMSEGWLDGEKIACPWHQWTFDLRTGHCTNIPGQKIRTFEVIENEGVVGIDL
ncbi:nitrite reductase (NADH) small subunit [Verrucomicrobium sp. GAS474]|uniref:Rieske (2Fe-2S) protein n=1 Tax=Verrucomicrobium sp. GAS474 TaxID=1882831 RepID=UPI00087B01F3|nr:Rieske 2Fe-2S domain-containing protein [Verrucomicrobium sp. GAS474]SDT92175.1 nitrite reductase (NADH) small subunit [Verrucomicrobium sp. GAS474]